METTEVTAHDQATTPQNARPKMSNVWVLIGVIALVVFVDVLSAGEVSDGPNMSGVMSLVLLWILGPAVLVAVVRDVAKGRVSSVLALIALAVLGMTAMAGSNSIGYSGGLEKARNSAVQGNINTVAMGLEQFATDHRDRYPAPGSSALYEDNYLPGNRLPRNPYGEPPQKALLPIPPESGWPQAAAIAKGVSPPLDGQELGVGHPPDQGGYDYLTYGALIYDLDPTTGAYVLYGVGKKGRKAVLHRALISL